MKHYIRSVFRTLRGETAVPNMLKLTKRHRFIRTVDKYTFDGERFSNRTKNREPVFRADNIWTRCRVLFVVLCVFLEVGAVDHRCVNFIITTTTDGIRCDTQCRVHISSRARGFHIFFAFTQIASSSRKRVHGHRSINGIFYRNYYTPVSRTTRERIQ